MKVQFGISQVELGSSQLGLNLRSCNDLMDNGQALRDRMAEDGYLLIRQLHDPAVVLKARRTIIQHMQEQTQCIAPRTDLMDAVRNADAKAPNMMGGKIITHHPDVAAVFQSKRVFDFFDNYFGQPSLTFDYKWLRAVGAGEGTPAHYDFVYMGRGSERLHTIWTPLGHITPDLGSLAILIGSHNLPSYRKLRETYGKSDVDRDGTHGHFTKDLLSLTDQLGGEWHTTTFEPGDVILFGMHTLHASTNNITDRWRISCDTRFQPASDPVDERWVGQQPLGHTGITNQPTQWKLEEVLSTTHR